MTHQDALDKVREHIKTQPYACVNECGEVMFEHHGDKCFLACLGKFKYGTNEFVGEQLGLNTLFALELSRIHDEKDPESWVGELNHLAEGWGLA